MIETAEATLLFTPEFLENIKFALFSTGAVLLILAILVLAWISTGLVPLNYYVWLVQLHSFPHRRIIQVFTMNDQTGNGLLDSALNETSQLVTEETNRNAQAQSSSRESNEESSSQTTVVIIQPPSSVTNNLRTSNGQESSQSRISGEEETNRSYRFELPSDSGEDINQIHRFLRQNTDSAIATAATIALYNRRMNEPNSNLLVSRVQMSVESEENPPTQNILISYDNLQPVPTHSGEPSPNPVHHPSSDSESSFTDGESSSSASSSASSSSTSSTVATRSIPEEPTQEDETTEADLTIKLKFLDDTQRMVKAWLTTTVGDFKRKNFSECLTQGKVVRLIFQGQLLRDDARSLVSYGIHDHCVLHCHVGNRPIQNRGQPVASNQSSSSVSNYQSTENIHRGMNATTFGARIISTGISWADILLLAAWNVLFSIYNWAQEVDNNNNTAQNHNNLQNPIGRRAVQGLRRTLRLLLNCLFDPNIRPTNNADDPFSNRFNAGALIGLLFALKFLTMWIFVLYFPQFSNPSTILLLTLLTFVMGAYFFFNRQMAGPNVQQIYNNH